MENKDRILILPQPKTVTADEFCTIAEYASKLLNVIKDWLPVVGDSPAKTSNPKTAELWFNQAARYYEDCELIRNSDYVPFAGRGPVMERGYSLGVHTDAFPYWQELLSTLDEIAVQYHWEGISDRSVLHGWNWWEGAAIPSIKRNTLDRLERAISGLLAVAEIINSKTNCPTTHDASGRGSDANRTQEKKSRRNLKLFDATCERVKKAYIRECVRQGKAIARGPFIQKELRVNASHYPAAGQWRTINKAFGQNPDSWKPDLQSALSKRTQTGRTK